ncbi:MAG: hypothetical protein ACKVKF_17245, partial [Rhodobacterales bacterium]
MIPPKANRNIQRDYDVEVYKWRHLVENYVAKIKEFRGIATRSDKTATLRDSRSEAFSDGVFFTCDEGSVVCAKAAAQFIETSSEGRLCTVPVLFPGG